MIGDPVWADMRAGERVSLVLEVRSGQDLTMGLWNREWFRIRHSLSEGVWTAYKALVASTTSEVGELIFDEETVLVRNQPLGETSFSTFKEVCGGIGGLAVGAAQVGIQTVASLDHNEFACRTQRLNGGTPIWGDVQNLDAQIALHQVPISDAPMLTAGIPCQPYSVQGAGQGLADPRGQVLFAVLQIGWHQQISGLLLECVSNIVNFKDTMQVLLKFAHDLGFNFSQVELDLAHQWAARRKRWWSIMLPQRLPRLTLLAWPVREPSYTVGEVLGELPLWSPQAEADLAWTSEEQACFACSDFGTDCRILEWNGQAPTALHSWGALLPACPCGCRAKPFSPDCLQAKGARGVGVFSVSSGSPRFPHAAEVGLLNSLPVGFKHLPDARTALCLVGNIAAPMQAAWICAQLAEWSTGLLGQAGPVPPLQVLANFQARLLQDRADFWPRPSQAKGGSLSIRRNGIEVAVQVCSQVQVSSLVRVYKEIVGPGFLIKVFDGTRRLSSSAFLLAGKGAPVYDIQVQLKKQAKPQPVHSPCGLPGLSLDLTSLEPAATPGTSDVVIWSGLQRAKAMHQAECCAIASPLAVTKVIEMLMCDPSASCSAHIATSLWPDEFSSCCLAFAYQGHWSLLVLGRTADCSADAWIYDGVRSQASAAGRVLAAKLCQAKGFDLRTVDWSQGWQQSDDGSCGAILLAHAALALSGDDVPNASIFQDAQAFVQDFPPHVASVYGRGALSELQTEALSKILVERGVPQAHVADRIKAAVIKVGGASIAQALQAKNVWQALKSAASKPGISFMWVLHSELQEVIQRKAQDRFGTSVVQPKQKKQAKAKARSKAQPLQVDAQQLQLVAGSFVSSQGAPLGQLSLAEVQAQATGVCFCSPAQAAPFLANLHSISTEALGLLTTIELPEDATGLASVSNLRFPAMFSPTGEGVLVKGSLIQLGDEQVQVAQDNIAEVEAITTVTIKVTAFRDELAMPWEQFITGPIKHLLQALPSLSVCQDPHCKQDCPRYHPPVDEPTEQFILDIWGRSFSKLEGGREVASTAAVFTSFWRIPLAALAHVHRIQHAGLYFEPRAGDGGPHGAFAVIWIPGADLSTALHSMRTLERVVAIARLGHRYGIRCKEADEQRLFEQLRPQHKFQKLRIKCRYRVHPLPHGLQRGSLQQLLNRWGWEAKPLQPLRGDVSGSAWEIGAADEPPSLTLPLAGDFVLVTKQKDKTPPPAAAPAILASTRTRKHLIYDDDGPTSAASPSWDPWQGGHDPWSKARVGAPPGLPGSPTHQQCCHHKARAA